MRLALRTTVLPMGPAAAIVLTDDEVAALGGGKRAAVRISMNGVTERLRLAVMGGQNLIGLRRDVRDSFGVQAGDAVDAIIELDEEPREVVVPDDLAAALAEAGVRETFDALAFTRRKEHVVWVEGAKRAETRARRVAATVDKMS